MKAPEARAALTARQVRRSPHAALWRWNYDIRVRYAPVAREVRLQNSAKDWTVLDVGCGEMGIAPWLTGWSVTGLDRSACVRLAPAARALRGSVVQLPFLDRSWDVVICVDVLEHLSPADRELALRELMRVVRQLLIVAHPAGERARLADERFRDAFGSPPNTAPQWLQEHLSHKYPDEDLVLCWLREREQLAAAAVQAFGNESLLMQRSHRYLALHSRSLYLAWSAACSLLAPVLGRPLDQCKAYRVVNVLRFKRSLAPSVITRQVP